MSFDEDMDDLDEQFRKWEEGTQDPSAKDPSANESKDLDPRLQRLIDERLAQARWLNYNPRFGINQGLANAVDRILGKDDARRRRQARLVQLLLIPLLIIIVSILTTIFMPW